MRGTPLVFKVALLISLLGGVMAASEPAPASFLPAPVAATVQQAWEANLGLMQKEIDLEIAASRLDEVKAALQPRLDLLGRYTRSDGGRTIDLPLGDLLNGAYATLNDYLVSQGRPASFGTISNQSVSLLRREEQETKVRLTQVLWRPELTRLARAGKQAVAAQEAQVSAYRRELGHVVASAHLQVWAAEAVVKVWESAAELTAEAVRVNQVLFDHDKTTEDALLRAKADALQVEEAVQAAHRDARAARMQLNFLLNRSLDTALEPAREAELEKSIQYLNTWTSRPGAGVREELRALDAALAATTSQADAARATLQPTLALVVEGGIQGERYRTDDRARYAQGSLVAEVNLWDGEGRRQRVRQAEAARRQLTLQRDQLALQLDLQFARAWDDFSTAQAALATAAARADAARRSFDIVTRRERAGVANTLAFLDARQERTAAELQWSIARYRLLISASALELSRGTVQP